jgi:hypothetical protein
MGSRPASADRPRRSALRAIGAAVARPFRPLVGEFFLGLDRILGSDPVVRFAAIRLFAALVAVWWIQVPIHELLHAAGCLATGGEVTRLEIAPIYGGTLLARIFPFVVSGGEYAGRLEGFTPSSDLGYLATIFAPYVLTILLGVPLLRAGRRRASPELFAAGGVFTLVPWISLTGDYFEMASVALTGIVAATGASPVDTNVLLALRSDDLFRLVRDLRLPSDAWDASFVAALVVASLLGAVLLAWGTCEVSRGFAGLLDRRRAKGNGGSDRVPR